MIGMRIGYRGDILGGMGMEWEGCGKGVPEEPDKWDIGDHWNNGYKMVLCTKGGNYVDSVRRDAW